MRILGHYVPPIVEALPATGVAGQEVVFEGRVHLWNTVTGKWEPELSHRTITLGADIVDSALVYQPMFSLPVEANALYEVEMHLFHQTNTGGTNLRVRTSGPTGISTHLWGAFAQATEGSGWVANANQYQPGVMGPNGVNATWINKVLHSRIMGTLLTVNSGTMLFEVASSQAGAENKVLSGSFFSYRRVV